MEDVKSRDDPERYSDLMHATATNAISASASA